MLLCKFVSQSIFSLILYLERGVGAKWSGVEWMWMLANAFVMCAD